jgi:hypothetical protein
VRNLKQCFFESEKKERKKKVKNNLFALHVIPIVIEVCAIREIKREREKEKKMEIETHGIFSDKPFSLFTPTRLYKSLK